MDETLTHQGTCFQCKQDKLVFMDYLERQATCPEHKHRRGFACCGAPPALCVDCVKDGWESFGGMGGTGEYGSHIRNTKTGEKRTVS